ncbi:amino acid/amide ABC transporter membrane protein 1, HAAT family (TC 3.A.1.4.-) [Enhydrobacter aerosaccus]|uniref:Amino acid/amide ABC transporter membrane protein 1, HAAT family (TC 3.A.1.4.-) n=1 Tax=Enhydrobacter aerosaccus TaxID=225324 RepID=A0A1T4ND88_9HYPH|nr:urea ABC transporter permease subunit UrtB [Enhydrobacter aerosaccus]SJZ76748.1 amino acid/amide ABC transporter membrane protein 1, HAAT family (TC 3.A.1.4.-) [Enhydrobacter aerosaccus]
MLNPRPLAALVSVLVSLVLGTAAIAADLGSLVANLTTGGFGDRETAITALAASGEARAAPILEALSAGRLYVRSADKLVVIGKTAGNQLALTDAITGQPAGTAAEDALERVRVNNRLRGLIDDAVGSLTLMSPDPKVRRSAGDSLFKQRNPAALAAVEHALAAEKDAGIKRVFAEARASMMLASDEAPKAQKLEAIQVVRDRGDRDSLGILETVASASQDADIKAAATTAAASLRQTLSVWEAAQNVWYGISLGSVLLLAAIGLAITFGTMGVINMAHGEMVMLGAYTTFVVQQTIRAYAPDLFEVSIVIALPLAFLVSGAIGVLIERTVIRFLYGRPLDTLLATWGLSLGLQQAVRTIFGPTNREVAAPSWMSGSFLVGQIDVTYGRLWIVVFALLVFATLILLLRKTPLGLYMRAVTQNRPMASAMGIRTPRVDALTFGLGSGIAGLAGVALSQIDNVSPNLGQGYIIDSFMVVVFGGVGNLFGTLVGATTLGIVNKFLEPYAGAVLGKILVLVFIILFIQRRPRGLFALKGRSVE